MGKDLIINAWVIFGSLLKKKMMLNKINGLGYCSGSFLMLIFLKEILIINMHLYMLGILLKMDN